LEPERKKKKSTDDDDFKTKTKIIIAPATKDVHINWSKYLEPQSIDDLVIHPKKLEEIKSWFVSLKETKANRILLVIGPSGCSKYISFKIIAKEAGYSVCEFISSSEYEKFSSDNFEDSTFRKQSQKFADYLNRCSRFSSIFTQKDRIVMVKDIPNIFLRKGNEEEFWDILRTFKSNSINTPIIFIVTETNSKHLNIEFNLFPDSIRAKLGIETINMNAISQTMMKKALKCACTRIKEKDDESFQQPSSDAIENIVVQSQGDIRNAILNLQMTFMPSSHSKVKHLKSTTNARGKRTKNKAKKEEKLEISNSTLARAEILDIFHGVGRALYPKFEKNTNTNMMQLTHNPEELAETFRTQPNNYLELLHSNYMKNFSELEDVCKASDLFTYCDQFQKEYRQADDLHFLNLNMMIRGVMVLNTKPPKGFRPITAYASKRFKSMHEKNMQKYLNNSTQCDKVSKNDFFLDYNGFSTMHKMLEVERNDDVVIEEV
jgi:cell cycle checkpoint protein